MNSDLPHPTLLPLTDKEGTEEGRKGGRWEGRVEGRKLSQRDLKCISLNERSRSKKAVFCVIPLLRSSGKGKTMEAAG